MLLPRRGPVDVAPGCHSWLVGGCHEAVRCCLRNVVSRLSFIWFQASAPELQAQRPGRRARMRCASLLFFCLSRIRDGFEGCRRVPPLSPLCHLTIELCEVDPSHE